MIIWLEKKDLNLLHVSRKDLEGNIRNAGLWILSVNGSVALSQQAPFRVSAKGSIMLVHEFKAKQARLRCSFVVSEPKVGILFFLFIMENFSHLPKWREGVSICPLSSLYILLILYLYYQIVPTPVFLTRITAIIYFISISEKA